MTFRNLSIQQKLRLIIMATTGVALMLACAAFLSYDQLAFRDSMKSDLDTLAEIFGSSSSAAISFGDQKDATTILAGLKAKPAITQAVIYSGTGKPFAQYTRGGKPGEAVVSPQIHADGSWFEGDRLQLFKQIQLDNQTIGVIYLESDLDALHSRFTRFAGMATGILFLSSLLARGCAFRPGFSGLSRGPLRIWRQQIGMILPG